MTSYSIQAPYKWLSYLWDTTLNRVCSNDKFDSMHGWYGFNAQIMWKICNFFVIFDDLWDLCSPYMTPYSIQAPYKWLFHLWNPQSCMFQWVFCFNVWKMCLYNGQRIWKIVYFCDFWWFWDLWSPYMTPYPTSGTL